MTIRHRPMEPKDVQECTEIIAKHAVLGPRYTGSAMAALGPAWLSLLGSEAMKTAVFEESEGSRARIRGFGVSVLVRDDFVRELKTPPLFWFGPELAKRIARGDSPVLSDKQIRRANSNEGLNLVVWEGLPRVGFETRADIYHLMMTSFLELHRGFLWKEMITSQADSGERLQWALHAGGLLWNPTGGRYVNDSKKQPNAVAKKPHIVGTTREMRPSRLGSWVGTLFDYHPPRCAFSRSEQHMLLMALEGGTDQELSQELNVSVPTVKKMWLSVYRRVEDHLPELNPNQSQQDVELIRRGKEKKRHFLAYLRTHPEELRPVSHKLLSQSATNDRLGRAGLKPRRQAQ